MVKCKPGQEQEAAIQIMRKALFRDSIGQPLGVSVAALFLGPAAEGQHA
jgi:hypothetical protein